MKMTIESTATRVEFMPDGEDGPVVSARVWRGHSEAGIPVDCYVVMVVPKVPKSDPQISALTIEFEHSLMRFSDPKTPISPIPYRPVR